MKISCDQVTPELARSLFRTHVVIEEKETGKTFPAFVEDCCGEDQHGFIVRIEKKLIKGLIRKYDMGPGECYQETHVGLDVRDIYQGKHFNLITETH